jgi:selenocysteine-specific elongation factor
VVKLEAPLLAKPFLAPKIDELAAVGLGVRELTAAERTRRVMRF